MVWWAISSSNTSKLAVLEGSQCSDDYIYTMSEYLLSFVHRRFRTVFVYQSDNASIHVSPSAEYANRRQ